MSFSSWTESILFVFIAMKGAQTYTNQIMLDHLFQSQLLNKIKAPLITITTPNPARSPKRHQRSNLDIHIQPIIQGVTDSCLYRAKQMPVYVSEKQWHVISWVVRRII